MKPVDRRKLMSALRKACETAGITLEEDPDAGSGSHGSLLFSQDGTTQHLRIIIVYAREISPGVQRAILQSLKGRATAGRAEADLAERLVAAWETALASL